MLGVVRQVDLAGLAEAQTASFQDCRQARHVELANQEADKLLALIENWLPDRSRTVAEDRRIAEPPQACSRLIKLSQPDLEALALQIGLAGECDCIVGVHQV